MTTTTNTNTINAVEFDKIMQGYFQVLAEEQALFEQICQEGGYGEYPLI